MKLYRLDIIDHNDHSEKIGDYDVYGGFVVVARDVQSARQLVSNNIFVWQYDSKESDYWLNSPNIEVKELGEVKLLDERERVIAREFDAG